VSDSALIGLFHICSDLLSPASKLVLSRDSFKTACIHEGLFICSLLRDVGFGYFKTRYSEKTAQVLQLTEANLGCVTSILN